MKLEAKMRTDEHHVEKHRSFIEYKGKDEIEIVFLGDSLTRRWEDNPALWQEFFGGMNAINMGVGADCLENILWRVENGELDGMKPRLVLFLGGTNNITADTPEYIASGVLQIAETVKQKCPGSTVVVIGLYPRAADDNGNDCIAKIALVNDMLEKECPGRGLGYEYYGNALLAPDGSIDRTIMEDGLHLNAAGYRIAGPIVKGIIAKYS